MIVNYDAAKKLMKHIEDAERKLAILKKYVNTREGTINTSVASRVSMTLDYSNESIRKYVRRFL